MVLNMLYKGQTVCSSNIEKHIMNFLKKQTDIMTSNLENTLDANGTVSVLDCKHYIYDSEYPIYVPNKGLLVDAGCLFTLDIDDDISLLDINSLYALQFDCSFLEDDTEFEKGGDVKLYKENTLDDYTLKLFNMEKDALEIELD